MRISVTFNGMSVGCAMNDLREDDLLWFIKSQMELGRCVHIEPEEGEPITLDYMPEVALEKIKAIREIVMSREHTINTMLDFYLSVYQESENDEKK